MADNVGFVVVEINQASHRPERVTADFLHEDQAWAEEVAKMDRAEAARSGRGERYIVCEVIPVEGADRDT